MNALGGLVVVLAAWLGGRALLPSREALPRSLGEEQGAAYLLGSTALILLAQLMFALGVPLSLPVAGALLALAAFAGGWRVSREARAGGLAESALPPAGRLLVLLLAAGSAAVTLSLPLNEFDPILHFAMKGRLLHGGELPTGEAFTAIGGEVGRVMTHPNYPLGVPLLEAFAAHAGGGWSDRWVQFPLALWSACLPAVVALGLRGLSPAAARAGALVAACTPALYAREFLLHGWRDLASAGLGEEKMLGGRGDLPVMALFGGAAAFMLVARRGGARAWCPAALAGLCLAGAATMKNEGLALAGVLALALLLAALFERGRGLREAGVALGLAALLLAPWLVVRAQLPAIDENYSEQVSLERVIHFWQNDETAELSPIRPENYGADWTDSSRWRPARVARYFGLEFVDLLSWGLLWPLAALGLIRALRRPEHRWLALTLGGGLALYALVLHVTPWFLPSLHKKGIPARLFVHLVGPAALLAGLLAAPRSDAHSG